jgi:NADH-quinone oxidoreductase subunit E
VDSRPIGLEQELAARSAALKEAQQELDAARCELAQTKERVRILEASNAAATAELAAVREAQGVLQQELESIRSQGLARVDDLKAIRGIGPKLSKKLEGLGFTRYAKLGALDAAGVEQLAQQLGIPPSRIERDGWIEAARKLSASSPNE